MDQYVNCKVDQLINTLHWYRNSIIGNGSDILRRAFHILLFHGLGLLFRGFGKLAKWANTIYKYYVQSVRISVMEKVIFLLDIPNAEDL